MFCFSSAFFPEWAIHRDADPSLFLLLPIPPPFFPLLLLLYSLNYTQHLTGEPLNPTFRVQTLIFVWYWWKSEAETPFHECPLQIDVGHHHYHQRQHHQRQHHHIHHYHYHHVSVKLKQNILNVFLWDLGLSTRVFFSVFFSSECLETTLMWGELNWWSVVCWQVFHPDCSGYIVRFCAGNAAFFLRTKWKAHSHVES